MKYINQTVNTDYLDGIKKHNSTLIKNIYSQFFPGIVNYIKKNEGNLEDAEDTFADALEIIFRKIRKEELTLHCSFYTYLFEVCKRQWSKVRRRKKIRKDISNTKQTKRQVENGHSFIEQRERYDLYQEKFMQLSPTSQQVLLMAIVEKKSMTEIATVMGYKSTGYARKRKHQCLQKLRALIQEDKRFEELVS